MSKRAPARVREPVQVYLDRDDAALLTDLATSTGLSKAELLRRGLRQLALSALAEKPPGWSLAAIPALLGDDPEYPADYAARHDEYLAGILTETKDAGPRPG